MIFFWKPQLVFYFSETGIWSDKIRSFFRNQNVMEVTEPFPEFYRILHNFMTWIFFNYHYNIVSSIPIWQKWKSALAAYSISWSDSISPMLFEVWHQCISSIIEITLMISNSRIPGNLLSLVTEEDLSILSTSMIKCCGEKRPQVIITNETFLVLLGYRLLQSWWLRALVVPNVMLYILLVMLIQMNS